MSHSELSQQQHTEATLAKLCESGALDATKVIIRNALIGELNTTPSDRHRRFRDETLTDEKVHYSLHLIKSFLMSYGCTRTWQTLLLELDLEDPDTEPYNHHEHFRMLTHEIKPLRKETTLEGLPLAESEQKQPWTFEDQYDEQLPHSTMYSFVTEAWSTKQQLDELVTQSQTARLNDLPDADRNKFLQFRSLLQMKQQEQAQAQAQAQSQAQPSSSSETQSLTQHRPSKQQTQLQQPQSQQPQPQRTTSVGSTHIPLPTPTLQNASSQPTSQPVRKLSTHSTPGSVFTSLGGGRTGSPHHSPVRALNAGSITEPNFNLNQLDKNVGSVGTSFLLPGPSPTGSSGDFQNTPNLVRTNSGGNSAVRRPSTNSPARSATTGMPKS